MIRSIINISSTDRAAALSLITMPFLESIESQEYEILETLYAMSFLERSFLEAKGIQWALSHPKLAGGIADDQRATVALVSLEWQYPESAAVIWELPWVRDGIAASETSDALALQELALNSEQVFQVLAQKSWIQDGLSRDEQSVIWDLRYIAGKDNSRRDEASALKIIAMPFLEAVDGADAAAVDSLSRLLWEWRSGQGYLQQVLSHPTLRDGITDGQAVLVSVLGMVSETEPESLDTLLDPERVSVEERVISLPRAGEVLLAVVHTRPGTYRTMGIIEHAVHAQEEFMLEAFPIGLLAALVADTTIGGSAGRQSGVSVIDYGIAEAAENLTYLPATAYWNFHPGWITEGAADLLQWVALDGLASQLPASIEPRCALANTISYLERVVRERQLGGVVKQECESALGFALFLDLYRSLGDGTFRRGFRDLYLKLKNEEHEDVCQGTERGVCYVKAAFVTDAAPQAAAIAEPIINRWYYGSASRTP